MSSCEVDARQGGAYQIAFGPRPVPDVLADVSGPTRALLMATHLVAAGIVVPTIARRLP